MPKGAVAPDTTSFRKKGTGQPILIDKAEGKCAPTWNFKQNKNLSSLEWLINLNLVERKARETEFKKPPVPKKDEKPIHGLVSDKNFIVANAVENILAAPNLPASKDKDYLKKKNFGKVPQYLTKIKNEIEDEYNLVREM